jgi:hypothetical protein
MISHFFHANGGPWNNQSCARCRFNGQTENTIFYYCAGWRYVVALIKVLTIYQIYHTCIHPLHHSPLSTPIPGTVSTDIIFVSTYMCTQYLHHIHPPTPFHLLPPIGTNPTLGRTCSALLFSDFLKEKNDIFAWDKGSYTGRFFVIFPCIYVL